jgi:hypothetical protein
MKLNYAAAALALMSLPVFGATITVTNTLGPVGTQSVVDNAGVPVSAGYAAIGIVDEAALVGLTSGQQLADAFTLFDNAQGPLNNAPFSGTFSVQSAGGVPLDQANPFSGKPIYLVLGNGADLASSTEAAVLKVGSFGNTEPTLATVNVRAGDVAPADILWGDNSQFQFSGRPTIALAPIIPEPSSSLLFGVAGLALLIRRKR